VAPGYFRSEMTEAIPPGQLASPASSYIAGITLAVDGGMSGH
jgi:NAD(P)-dependent dehydrogenase (short-subunit alcohol dehydrogenase family)